MKKMKKIVSLLLAMVMVLAMTSTVFASETTKYTITINNETTGHTYQAYQIFAGDLSEGTLSNIVWGSGITEAGKTALGDAKTKAESLTNEASAKEFAKSVSQYLNVYNESTYNVIEKKYKVSGLEAGYYLVKDKDSSLEEKDDAYTSYIVKVVKDVEASPKSVKPTVDKQVLDEVADAESGATDGWGESADHAINETFQFKLIAHLPESTNYADYDKYAVKFTDTMSTGVTFESIASVTVDGITVSAGDGETNYECTATSGMNGDGQTPWTLTIENVKGIAGVDLSKGADVVVIYNAHLNESAQINKASGTTTNKNDVYLEYFNNPNASGTGEWGKTEKDTVWVFTYLMDNTKIDGAADNNETPLAGAGFRLYSDKDCTSEIRLIYDNSLSAYRPIKNGENSEEMISAQTTGKFDIRGLDAGTYYLKETTTPAGYNTCDVVEVEISAAHVENTDGSSAETNLTIKKDGTGVDKIKIVNNKGTVLPETGGMGTTIFYVVGVILVLGAVVLLITKKRMSANK